MVDVSEIKTALFALNERRRERAKLLRVVRSSQQPTSPAFQNQMDYLAKYFSLAEDAFRRGIEDQDKATEQLATVAPPFTPTYIRLETPFMIWAEPAHILMDSHIESENNWAKVLSKYGTGGY